MNKQKSHGSLFAEVVKTNLF